MRRSLYERTFLKGSSLYHGEKRRQSTLPSHLQKPVFLQVKLPPPKSLSVPSSSRQEIRARSPLRFSCSAVVEEKTGVQVIAHRSYLSTNDELTGDFPLRIKRDLSVSTQQSQDSDSSGSYVSPRSHRSASNQAEEFEMDVFSRQSSDASEELQKRDKVRRDRILSYQETRQIESTDTETWKTCASAGDAAKSEPIPESSPGRLAEFSTKSKETISWGDSVESDISFSQSVIDMTKGEGYDFAIKQFESFDQLCQGSFDDKEEIEGAKSNEDERKTLGHELFQWNKSYCDDYDSENLASNRNENEIAFKIDFYASERGSNPPDELPFNANKGLFPGKKKVVSPDEAGCGSGPERDEGFDSPVFGSRDADELGDLFASREELARREAFRKERSLDSDETSGFISKHSSETTDLSSRMSSTHFTTKHLSEPLGFGLAGTPSDMPRQQHLSEPSDMPQHLATPCDSLPPLPNPDYGPRRMLSVDSEAECSSSGAMSKRREHFRRSKRLKHFNLRRIDDTDNDSSCDSERPPGSLDEPQEPPSTRLKEEVGLPKHLSREYSIDRYGLYKSRSEKTITSFESEHGGSARLQDFESFCEAVNFAHRAPVGRQKAASADEMDLSDEPGGSPKSRTPPRTPARRKSRSKRDLTRRLKCLLL